MLFPTHFVCFFMLILEEGSRRKKEGEEKKKDIFNYLVVSNLHYSLTPLIKAEEFRGDGIKYGKL